MAPEAQGTGAPRRRSKGSVTLVALCLMTTLGIALGSYLALCARSAQASARLVNQDQAQQLAQTGLEEALWALNQDQWTASGPAGTTSWTTSGAGADRTTTLTYTLPAPASSGQVVLTIANYASVGPAWPTITAAATITLLSGQTFTKTLQAKTGPTPVFGNAIASSESFVSLQGGTVDSWNSDPLNTGNFQNVYQFTGVSSNYAAVIAGFGNGNHGVMLGKTVVCGYAATSGPSYSGLPVSYDNSGAIKPKVQGPNTAAGVNIDPARLGKSAFMPGATLGVILPPTNGANFHSGLITDLVGGLVGILGAAPASVDTFKSGDLTVNSVLNNVTITRPTKLIVDGDLTISTFLIPLLGLFSGKITIAPTGSLELYVTGDVTIGADGFDNQTNDPRKLAIYCTSTSTSDSLQYTSTRDFCGVIFCENKPIDIQKNVTFYGALFSRQRVTFSTDTTFHYDTALRQVRFKGVTTPYLIKQLTEL